PCRARARSNLRSMATFPGRARARARARGNLRGKAPLPGRARARARVRGSLRGRVTCRVDRGARGSLRGKATLPGRARARGGLRDGAALPGRVRVRARARARRSRSQRRLRVRLRPVGSARWRPRVGYGSARVPGARVPGVGGGADRTLASTGVRTVAWVITASGSRGLTRDARAVSFFPGERCRTANRTAPET